MLRVFFAATLFACGSLPAGVSAQAERLAQRAALREVVAHNLHGGQHVNHATIADGYALIMLSDANTGGEQIYKLRKGHWTLVGGGGGAAAAMDLEVLYKVPAATAERLVTRVEHAPKL